MRAAPYTAVEDLMDSGAFGEARELKQILASKAKMEEMQAQDQHYEIYPYIGLGKLRFGMTRDQVYQVMGFPIPANSHLRLGNVIAENYTIGGYTLSVGYWDDSCEYLAIFNTAGTPGSPWAESPMVIVDNQTDVLNKTFGEMKIWLTSTDLDTYFDDSARSLVSPKLGFLFVSDGNDVESSEKGLLIEMPSKRFWPSYVLGNDNQ